MPRILTSSFFVLVLIVSAAGAAPAAHANHVPGADPFHGDTPQAAQDLQTAGESSTPVPAQSAAQAQQAINSAAQTPSPGGSKEDAAYDGIMIKIMQLFAWLAGAAMVTLDYATYYTVVKMGSIVNGLPAVGIVWKVLRDIGNIFLIFGFLAVGVTTILNVDWYGGKTKMLPMMFVAAVFLNFSLFISEAFIDVSNLFATQFYTQINGGNSVEPPSVSLSNITDLGNRGVSAKIMSQLGLASIYGQVKEPDTAKAIFQFGQSWVIGFMGILLFIILAFVLFSLAFVLIARFVILLFLIIVSPVAFAGLAVPGLSARTKQWWDTLFEQVLTAPILLLMLYIALRVITDTGFIAAFGGGTDWLGYVENKNLGGFGSMLLSFLVAMGLLLVVVIQSKNLSAFGAGKAINLAGKLSFGATAWAGRNTGGRLAVLAARGLRKTSLGTQVPHLMMGLDRIGKASFDVRGTGVLKSLPEGGIDAGKAHEGGYRKMEEEAIKGREEYAKTLPGRSQTDEEKATLSRLEGEKLVAQRSRNSAASEKDAAANEKVVREREKTALDEERNRDRYWDTNPENVRRMETAEQNLRTSEEKLTAATNNLAQREAELTATKSREDAQKTDIQVAVAERGSAQERYADNITVGPLKWLYRNKKAAENIKANAKKSKSDKNIDTLKELLRKASKDKDKNSSESTPPPAPPPPAAAH